MTKLNINTVVNAFIEAKKLKLSNKKCSRIHIAKKNSKNSPKCSKLKADEYSSCRRED